MAAVLQQKQILEISGIPFVRIPETELMMTLTDYCPRNVNSASVLPTGVHVENQVAYFQQKAAVSIAKRVSAYTGLPKLRLPSFEEWLSCIHVLRPLALRDVPDSRWITSHDFKISARLTNPDINGKKVVEFLELKHCGYRYASANIVCRSGRDGRYWSSTPGQYIHLDGDMISLNCITERTRYFPIRLVTEIPEDCMWQFE